MKRRWNLLSAVIARDVLEEAFLRISGAKEDNWFSYEFHGLTFTVRPSNQDWKNGAMNLTVTVPAPIYHSGPKVEFKRYLPYDWTSDQFKRAVSTLYFRGVDQMNLDARRTDVYEKAGALIKTGKLDTAKALQIEEETGHTVVYRDMTKEDCAFWLDTFSVWGSYED